jgi:hypothetical protein
MFKKVLAVSLLVVSAAIGGLLTRPLLSGADVSSGDRSVLVPVVPARLLDTRPGSPTVDGQFQAGGKLGAAQTLNLTVAGRGGVPADATAVVLNVTAVEPTAPTFLTLWPTTAARPLASNLNPTPGQPPTPNLVTVGVGGGSVSIFNFAGDVHVFADVTGYYANHDHDDRYASRVASVQATDSIQVTGAGGPQTILTLPFTVPPGRVADVSVFFNGQLTHASATPVGLCFGEVRLDDPVNGTVLAPGELLLLDGDVQPAGGALHAVAASLQALAADVSSGLHTLYMRAETGGQGCFYGARTLMAISNLRAP